MNHLSDDALALYYYGEPEDSAEAHLGACDDCRVRYQRLQRVLNSVNALAIPERQVDYEVRLWRTLEPSIPCGSPRKWMTFPVLRWAGACALLLAAIFLARSSKQVEPRDREGVLALAVGEHLERAQLILAEVSNGGAQRDISFEQGTAEELLEANRLYRQAAMYSGDRETAEVLDGLERALAEIAHLPAHASREELVGLQQGIRRQGILLQVRNFETRSRPQL